MADQALPKHTTQSSNGGNARTLIKTKPRCGQNRVLVTGGAGFVGSHLCEFLVKRGDHVSCCAVLLCVARVCVCCGRTAFAS